MELAPLKAFLAIAREGHLTRAARALHLSQPAVSAQLARLEDDLGASLFHRTAKGMALTEAGELFRGYAEQALLFLDDGREALDALRGLEAGQLAVGGGATATTYLLPPLLRRFHEAHPAIRLYVREQGSAAIVDGVLAGDLDLGVVTLPVDTRGGRLHVESWVQDDMRLVVPPGHRLSRRRRFRWVELADEPLVLFEGGTAVRRVIDAALADAGVEAQIVMELRSIESIKQMVAQGIGSAFVSRYALPGPRAGLVPMDGADQLVRELAIIRRADRRPSAASRAFLSLIREPRD
ncbi:MAG: LysR family transcriptional regulator [Deltaproteobacteria bacterium]|nr:MAG: LysR family transcriptional regulator [Deltaproteobacteria bacterium]